MGDSENWNGEGEPSSGAVPKRSHLQTNYANMNTKSTSDFWNGFSKWQRSAADTDQSILQIQLQFVLFPITKLKVRNALKTQKDGQASTYLAGVVTGVPSRSCFRTLTAVACVGPDTT